MEEDSISQGTTKQNDDFPWLIAFVIVLLAVFAKFLFDNYQKEIYYLLQVIIAIDLLLFVLIIYYLFRQDVWLHYKEIIWNFGLLFLLAASILIVYYSNFQNRYSPPTERDPVSTYTIPFLQFFGLTILLFSIFYIFFMLILTVYVYKNSLQDEHLSGLILNQWNYRFLILIGLFFSLIFSMMFGVGLFGKQPESEVLQILGDMFK